MATTAKKKRRTTRSVAKPRARRRTTVKKRRPRGLSDGLSGKPTLMKSAKTAGGGALGGAIYSAPQFIVKLPTWGKVAYGVATAIGAGMMKAPSVSAGIAGATSFDLIRTLASPMLKDDLEDAEYVDPSTLSDSGLEDENGNAVAIDDNGNVFALNDGGDYVMIGRKEDLQDAFDLQDDMQSVSMVPLSDPYSLQDNMGAGNAYSLASGY